MFHYFVRQCNNGCCNEYIPEDSQLKDKDETLLLIQIRVYKVCAKLTTQITVYLAVSSMNYRGIESFPKKFVLERNQLDMLKYRASILFVRYSKNFICDSDVLYFKS